MLTFVVTVSAQLRALTVARKGITLPSKFYIGQMCGERLTRLKCIRQVCELDHVAGEAAV